MLEIELGSSSNKDARKLAQQAGLEDLYRLAFTPSSGDLHGSWVNLKILKSGQCEEPLHRWQSFADLLRTAVFVNTAIAAQELYTR